MVIGASAVPSAIILAPLAIIKVEASAPVPEAAFMIVPAGMVNVEPLSTETLPFKSQTFEASKVLSEVIFPSKVEPAYSSTSTSSVSVSVTVSVIINSSSTDHFVIKDAPIPVGSSLELIDSGSKIVMQNSDVLKAYADTASSVDVLVSFVAVSYTHLTLPTIE